ncbi:Uncharacterised protein [Amycolatopsis camponoti]|uniref:Uncharacterized protein n=1 Tax=Amycolatopsis camponoti TaxID=2606593 RepID=A0A6I8LS45_9PSEU|nr:Uncharacterised protein [Amycolatopsis camponoti]
MSGVDRRSDGCHYVTTTVAAPRASERRGWQPLWSFYITSTAAPRDQQGL